MRTPFADTAHSFTPTPEQRGFDAAMALTAPLRGEDHLQARINAALTTDIPRFDRLGVTFVATVAAGFVAGVLAHLAGAAA